ncbi:MAG: Cd(II)/Pb(II)-responsive transcriptional regulator [Rhodoferax sp.]
MKIGALALATATPVETIRYYEREGLLPAPARTTSNYRHYEAAHVQRLAFIRHCRGLDMSLQEVRVLLNAMDAPFSDCGAVNALLDAHIGHVRQRIGELRALQKQLQDLRARCARAQDPQNCGILADLQRCAAGVATPAPQPETSHLRGLHRDRTRG